MMTASESCGSVAMLTGTAVTGWKICLVSSMTVLLKQGSSGLGVSSSSGTSSSVHWLRSASIVCFSLSKGSALSV